MSENKINYNLDWQKNRINFILILSQFDLNSIWSQQFDKKLTIFSNSAKTDPFNPNAWWKEGRQIRWVMAEYGGWFFLFWKQWFAVK